MSLGRIIKAASLRQLPYSSCNIPISLLIQDYKNGQVYNNFHLESGFYDSFAPVILPFFDDLLISLDEFNWKKTFGHHKIYLALLNFIANLADDLLAEGPASQHDSQYQAFREVIFSFNDLSLITHCEPLSPSLIHERSELFWNKKILPFTLEKLFSIYGYPESFNCPYGNSWRPSSIMKTRTRRGLSSL